MTVACVNYYQLATDIDIPCQIEVKTTDKCTALQWLTPAQTSNKKHPYMCQSQAIYR